ncbi:HTH-type transcriptional repressor Bm3R1 [Fervidicola ferrireducens]|uniref:HTH-type transcriptional repressor Bm3R1 n=1 Tax=Fervidicola ferrireducens TaxID=520764 RepID=A0A140L8S2_9FIRM|nr:TetR/AcrR family transcriptional regulator [Fervidicola ferrireducens]KXG76947.1 HTH-type transcriptional repressor Bm3R1 [Fervidicola ferrireducens]
MNKEKQVEKRSSILEAAASIFSNKGYPNTKMQDIAEKAGIGKGTIYQYFKSKKHLFQQIIKEGIDLYTIGLKNEIKGYTGLEEILKKIVRFSFSFMEKHGGVLKIIASHHTLIDESMVKWIYDRKTKIINLLSKIIDESTEKIAQNAKDTNLAAYCFFGMMISVIEEKVFHNREFDVEEVSDQLVKIFLYGYM